MQKKIEIGILERYQLAIDGYIYRVQSNPEIEVVSKHLYAADFERNIDGRKFDVLICGVDVPVSFTNPNPFPIISFLNWLSGVMPNIKVLVISYVYFPQIVYPLIKHGVNGYILKQDNQAILNLSKIIEVVYSGGAFFSEVIQRDLMGPEHSRLLTARQMEILMLCASDPDADTLNMAKLLNISDSTLRNILSQIYKKLDVRTKAAAIIKARQMGIIPSDSSWNAFLENQNEIT